MQSECALLRGLTAVGLASLAAAQTCTTDRVSLARDGGQGDRWSLDGALSSDGRFVVFVSAATNLVPGDTNGNDVFVRDLVSGVIERVSVNGAGDGANARSHGPSISADARYVAFWSLASNLVPNDPSRRTCSCAIVTPARRNACRSIQPERQATEVHSARRSRPTGAGSSS